MPNLRSAEKRMRQNTGRRMRNRQRRSQMRTEIKRFRKLVGEEKVEEAREALKTVYAIIDRTAQKGVFHSNTAARYKSRLTKHLNESVS